MENVFDRILSAQNDGDNYAQAVAELRAGRKASDWMWYIFPSLIDNNEENNDQEGFRLHSTSEAVQYLAHPTLGNRLRTCTRMLLDIEDKTITDIVGEAAVDDLQASMTLFNAVSPNDIFAEVLAKYFDSKPLDIGLNDAQKKPHNNAGANTDKAKKQGTKSWYKRNRKWISSVLRLLGFTELRRRFSRKTGIPTTRAGAENAIGKILVNLIFGKSTTTRRRTTGKTRRTSTKRTSATRRKK